jgi:hypothetical protein
MGHKIENLNKEVIPDPLTGGSQTIYWNDENTFLMSIPDRCIPFPPDFIAPKYRWTDNKDGSKNWEIQNATPDKP